MCVCLCVCVGVCVCCGGDITSVICIDNGPLSYHVCHGHTYHTQVRIEGQITCQHEQISIQYILHPMLVGVWSIHHTPVSNSGEG